MFALLSLFCGCLLLRFIIIIILRPIIIVFSILYLFNYLWPAASAATSSGGRCIYLLIYVAAERGRRPTTLFLFTQCIIFLLFTQRSGRLGICLHHPMASSSPVCSMASLERQKLKVKFDPVELEVLVDEANKHLIELQQRSLAWSHSRSPECVDTK